MKPLALDLCCGKGGWTNGLLATGWDVIGVDIQDMGGYPEAAHLVFADVRAMAEDLDKWLPALAVDLVVASPPCQEFSFRRLPFGRVKNLPPPDKTIWRACVRIADRLQCPLVLENVAGAQDFMGRSRARYGPYHFWGDVPPLMPMGRPKPKHIVDDMKNGVRRIRPGSPRLYWSGSAQRKNISAVAAMIPFELAHWVGEYYSGVVAQSLVYRPVARMIRDNI